MIGIDTNVLVRYLTKDDKAQTDKAIKFIEKRITEKEPGFINSIVLIEIVWVLESCYGADKQTIGNVIRQLASTQQLVLQDAEIVLKSLCTYMSNNIDFSDAYLSMINNEKGCGTTITFDKRAGKTSRFTLLK